MHVWKYASSDGVVLTLFSFHDIAQIRASSSEFVATNLLQDRQQSPGAFSGGFNRAATFGSDLAYDAPAGGAADEGLANLGLHDPPAR